MIAGHTFSLEGKCTCGKRFGDISDARREHVGKPDWAHSGTLTEHELNEIIAERERIYDLAMEGARA
jgi:hypothetical protein